MKIALVLLLAMVTAATAQQKSRCYTSPDFSVAPLPWAWRMIDGRTCWYPGERKRDKSLLYWPQQASTESAAPAKVSASPATEAEPPTTVPEPEPTPEPTPASEPLQSYSPEDQKLLESYWPDLSTLLAERSPTHQEMFKPSPPPMGNWRDARTDDYVIVGLVVALVLISGLVWGLEALRTKLDMRRTA